MGIKGKESVLTPVWVKLFCGGNGKTIVLRDNLFFVVL